MTSADLEKTYEQLAVHLDAFDEASAPVYLAKVALLLAMEIDDLEAVERCMTAAARNLQPG